MPTENEKENKGNEEIENTGGAADNADNPGNENETPADAGADDGQTNSGAEDNAQDGGEETSGEPSGGGTDDPRGTGTDDDAAAATTDELSEYKQRLKNLSSRYAPQALSEPARPDKERDEAPEEWEQYRADMAVFKAQKSQQQAETQRAFNEIKAVIIEQRQAFEKNHTPEESVAFFNWLNNDTDMQNSITRGARSMQQVYNNIYLPESRGAQSQRRIAEIKAQGARHKAANVSKRVKGAGGRFAGLKYAWRPEYSDLAESLAKEVKDV